MESEEEELCFPHLFNSSCRKPQIHISETVPVYTVVALLSLFTTTLNLLVIISIAHFRSLHSPTNLILLSLAVSDFFIGFVSMPTETVKRKHCWVLGEFLCATYNALAVTFITASTISMVLISVDRYVAICFPMHYQTTMTLKVVRIIVSVCWAYSAGYPCVIFHENFSNLGKYKSCYGECVVYLPVTAELMFADLILVFFLPISIIVVLYMRVFVVAASQARAMRSHVTGATLQTVKSKKSEIKAARNLGVLVIVFLICYCPFYIIVLSGDPTVNVPAALFFMYVNSCINPLIYALFYPWFRKAVKHVATLQILSPGSCDLKLT